ncbi:hypothetical protein JYU34_015235 [Plutella xylostella]|uniref:Uncharacterized protein n=1 Tax=Plutella xylostella TaxID=51655 RepID=A0ABQ7QAC1_PLUXY|nr:hypothetical protein JYU34_015235 [Plutella xylostella]
MAELDRFKRRFIRAVARLMRQGVPERDMWETLSKETGRDSQELWNRMKVLCLKKLSRLLAANDSAAQVGNVARMTPTDWLMFDAVLVHEKPDVCTPDNINTSEVRISALQQLIVLVDQYDIEKLPRDVHTRAGAWAALTTDYNVDGRECSPMLLQLRWYQLKQTTRAVFYQFWSKFRGNKRNLEQAQHLMPSQLQSVIAKRYPTLITMPFVPWEEQIQQHLVVTLEEMGASATEGNDAVRGVFDSGRFLPPDSYVHRDAKKSSDEPDLVLVEPKIDTIAVDDSDNEEADKNEPESTTTNDDTSNLPVTKVKVEKEPVTDANVNKDTEKSVSQAPKVKQEPVDDDVEEVVDSEVDGLSNVKILEATHVQTEEIDDDNHNTSNKSNEAEKAAKDLEKVYNNLDNFIDNTPEVVLSDLEDDCILTGIDDNTSEINANSAVDKPNEESIHTEDAETNTNKLHYLTETDNNAVPNPDNTLMGKLRDNIITKHSEQPEIIEDDNLDDPIIIDTAADVVDKPAESELNTNKSPIFEIPDDIEIVDDGIDVDDYEDDIFQPQSCEIDSIVKPEPEESSRASEEGQEETSGKFDLKLMMFPVVYTTKLDHMSVCKDHDFESVKTVELIDSILSESKPISTKSVILTPIETPSRVLSVATEGIVPAEENVPVLPVAPECTSLLPVAGEEKSRVLPLSAEDTINVRPDINEQEDSGEDSESDYETIPETSSLFQKPRVRDYNPIKLCKNPDFNTRLKWLSVGFFASERNRRLLNACHPVTIDLHSAFEPKLVNNTVRLKKNNTTSVKVSNNDTYTNTSESVIPSTMLVQSLVDKTNTNIEDLMPTPQSVNERDVINLTDGHDQALVTERKNKVISLPDIVNVRRLNQQLLTAEVAPIQLVNDANSVEEPDVKPDINVLAQTEKQDTGNNIENEVEVKPSIENLAVVPCEALPEAAQTTIEDTTVVSNETIVSNEPVVEAVKAIETKYEPNVTLQSAQPLLTMEISPIRTQAPPVTVTSVPAVAGPSVTSSQPAEAARRNNKPKKKRPEATRVPWYASNATPKDTNTGVVENTDSLIAMDTLDRMLHIIMGTPVDKVYGTIKTKNIVKMIRKGKSTLTGGNLDELELKLGFKSTDEKSDELKAKEPVKPKPVARKRSSKSIEEDKTEFGNIKKTYKCRAKTRIQPAKSTPSRGRPRKVYLEPRSPPTSQVSDADQQQNMDGIIAGITITPLNQHNVPCMNEISANQPAIAEVGNNVEVSTQTMDAVTDITNEIPENTANLNNTPYTFEIAPAVGINVEVSAKKHSETLLNSSNDSNQYVILSDDESETSSKSSPTKRHDPCKLPVQPKPAPPPKKGVWKTNYVINSRKDLADTCPIDLGPGQVLLTTAKIPPHFMDSKVIPHQSTPEVPPVPPPAAPLPTVGPATNLLGLTKIEIPGLELPEGVSLMLGPNGDLSAVLSADVEYDANTIAEMQSVVSIVQQQISMSLKPPAVADSVDLTDEPTTAKDGGVTTDSAENKTESNASLATSQEKQPIHIAEDTVVEAQSEKGESNCNEKSETKANDLETTERSEVENTGVQESSENKRKQDVPDSATIDLATEDKDNIDTTLENRLDDNAQVGDKDRENVDTNVSEETTSKMETNTEESSRPAPAATKKSILSDLMEMSGISSEDMVPAEAPAEVVQTPTMVPQTPAPVNVPDTTSSGYTMRAELTQVKTVEALKYAAQVDGKFFKYNLKTGSVTLIKVTIEKVEKNPRPSSSLLRNSFIDLTSTEAESPRPVQVIRRGRGRPARLSKVLAKPPIIMSGHRRRGRPPRHPHILNEDYDSDSYRPPPPVLKKIVNEKVSGELNREVRELRKQRLGRKARIEAKIYLDDSDGPAMEEEYLVDSQSDDDSSKKGFVDSNLELIRDIEKRRAELHSGIITADSSDDDEPLAKKVKKKSEVIPPVPGISSASGVEDVIPLRNENSSETLESNVVPIGLPHPAVPVMEVLEEDLLDCDDASQDTPDTQESEEEEECILGA